MPKMFEVAKYEYTHHVFRKRFWIILLLVPVGIVIVTAFSVLLSAFSINTDPVGYVDEAGLISIPQAQPEKRDLFEPFIPLLPFEDEASARKAAEDGDLQAYFIIPASYETDFTLNYFFIEDLNEAVRSEIRSLLRQNLLSKQDIPNLARLTAGSEISLESLDGSDSSGANNWLKIVIPIFTSLMFLVVVLSSSGYLLQSVVDEKQNRTMEIMITSVSPSQLMAGKIIGNISVGLTQILAWILVAAIPLLIFGNRLNFLKGLDIGWGDLFTSLALLLPAFVTTSALMATLGATVTDTQESQQVSGLVVLPTMLPIYFITPIIMNPNGVLARVLTFFPLSAPVATSLRLAFTDIPGWELLLVILISVSFAVFSVWLAGKAFRIGMLQYSKRIPLSQLLRKEASRE